MDVRRDGSGGLSSGGEMSREAASGDTDDKEANKADKSERTGKTDILRSRHRTKPK